MRVDISRVVAGKMRRVGLFGRVRRANKKMSVEKTFSCYKAGSGDGGDFSTLRRTLL
jgi:hypothetical protein